MPVLISLQRYRHPYRQRQGVECRTQHSRERPRVSRPHRHIPGAARTPTKLSGIITEPDAGDTFFLDVNWGDGTPIQTFTFLAGSFISGQTRVTVEHIYSHVGRHRISLTWRDQTGLSNDDNTLVAKILPTIPPHRSKPDQQEDDQQSD